jgi:hypothetical protein
MSSHSLLESGPCDDTIRLFFGHLLINLLPQTTSLHIEGTADMTREPGSIQYHLKLPGEFTAKLQLLSLPTRRTMRRAEELQDRHVALGIGGNFDGEMRCGGQCLLHLRSKLGNPADGQISRPLQRDPFVRTRSALFHPGTSATPENF